MAITNGFSSEFSFSLLLILLVSSVTCLSQASTLSHSKVEYLPGFDGPLPFSLETGYIGVDEGEEVQLFYYFIESENNPKEDPLLLWLTGGPSCSTLSAIVLELGPIKFEEVKYNGSLPKLILRPYSWTKMASIIFLDLPVDTGFSYSKTFRGSCTGDFKSTPNANEFLRKWLVAHPKLQSNPIYVGGDSYSGMTLPLYFNVMLQGNEDGMEPFLNLKGYILGNPFTDRALEKNYAIPFAHGMGLISDELYWALEKSCDGEYYEVDSNNVACKRNLETFQKLLDGLSKNGLLLHYCPNLALQRRHELLEKRMSIFEEYDDSKCTTAGTLLVNYWANDESVQKALHVRKGSIKEWIRCNRQKLNYTYDLNSSIVYHAELSAKGYRSLIYSGDHDIVVPFLATQAWIRTLNYSIVDDWRQWLVDGQVAGYTRTYSNKMTFATIKGAAHVAIHTNPKECAAMAKRWLSGEPL